MYENGFKINGVQKDNVKKELMEMLKKIKTGIKPTFEQMCTILTNIEKCDHHDLCRLDQILTILKNENCTDYQWGSVTLNCKWKIM